MLNKNKLDLMKMLGEDIPDWHYLHPSAQEQIASWILEDRQDVAEKVEKRTKKKVRDSI